MVVDGPIPQQPRAWRRPAESTPADVRWLAWHEARSHALISREVRDLGDGWLLYDATDREPFWNRIAGVAWPAEPGAFDRRVAEILALFAGLDRIPHVWAFPGFDEPDDLTARLLAFGFEDHGGGLMLALDHDHAVADHGPIPDLGGRSLTVERLHRLQGIAAEDAARAIAEVLVESFEVEDDRRVAIELEAVLGLSTEPYHAVLVRVDGQPAAVARRTTFAGTSYLSSIGTAPAFRGQGLGRLVTSLVVADAVVDGSGWIYLGVFEENDIARRLYASLGFVPIGGVNPDLLLRA
jgi:ribosomal protein S18 acetylase RimI-like enzyme